MAANPNHWRELLEPGNEKDLVFQMCDAIRETAFAIHQYHGSGHLEKIYENALGHRMRNMGMRMEAQVPIVVRDEDETPLGEFFADLIADGILIIEVKAARSLAPEHVAQLLGYLRGTNVEHGLLINFGAGKLEIKKVIMNERF